MLDTVNNLLVNTTIPAMDAVQMSDLLQYLFSTAEKTLRIQVAEIVYRNDHHHRNAQDIFLACTLPIAEKAASRKAHKLFISPSDWQVELMYDGAVKAMIVMFQCNYAVRPGTDAFRRYVLRALALGMVRSYFMREEYDSGRHTRTLSATGEGDRSLIPMPSRKRWARTEQLYIGISGKHDSSCGKSSTQTGSCSSPTDEHKGHASNVPLLSAAAPAIVPMAGALLSNQPSGRKTE